MKQALMGLVVVSTLVVAAPASAKVQRQAFTATVQAGKTASLTVRVTPRARCTIKVIYATVVSKAKGLGAKTGGTITWRWRVGTSTHPGRWPVRVDCGKSGKLNLRVRVTPR